MLENVNPVVRPPQALQFNAHANLEMNRVSQPYLPLEQARSAAEPATAEPVTEPPRVTSVELSRVMWNAESMIAAALGLKTYEVIVAVNAGRYSY